ncbi:MAG: TetR/AcrR family transcriptional regulator [Clostridia bacterium]
MNTGKTSKETILDVCRRIVADKGLSALNMRTVAKESHIALGTLYNYYADKDELLLATVESVWKDIFHVEGKCEAEVSFPEYIGRLFDSVREGAGAYPDFLAVHSVPMARAQKGRAKNTMEQYFEHIKSGMLGVLRADPKVSPDAFSSTLTEAALIDFVFDQMLLMLSRGETSSVVLVEILSRVLYPSKDSR